MMLFRMLAAAVAFGSCLPIRAMAAGPAIPSDIAIAYDHPHIVDELDGRPIVVSPDGRNAIYTVNATSNPEESQRGMFLANGSPLTSDGDRLWTVSLADKASHAICPAGGNDWNPSFSPDGRTLAFYSDRTGQTRLWLYDVASQRCRQPIDTPIKSTYFPSDYPRWSPDGQTIYVSIWPTSGPGIPSIATKPVLMGHAPEVDASGVTVLVHDPVRKSTGLPSGTAFDQLCSAETYLAASIGAIRLSSGGVTTLVDDAVAGDAARGAERHHPSPYFNVSPSGRWISYYSTACSDPAQRYKTSVDLYIAPAAGGTPIRIAAGLRSPGGGMEFDWGYRWHPREDALVYLKDGKMTRVRIGADGALTTVEIGKGLGPIAPSLLRFTADGRSVVVGIAAEEGSKPKPVALASVPFDGTAPTQLALGDADLTVQMLPTDTGGTAWQTGDGAIVARGVDEKTGDSVLLGFDFAAGKMKTLWHRPAGLNGIVPVSHGALAVYDDFATPPDVYAISTDWRRGDRLTHVAPGLDALRPGTIEQFASTIATADGALREVHSSIILPPGAKRGDRLPAVVWFYPSVNFTRAVAHFGAPTPAADDLAHIFTARGYAVLLVDMPLPHGDKRGNVIDEIMDDLMPQVRKAIDLGYIDPDRLALRGQSFGGFATAAVITRTNLFRAAIASGGMYDLGAYFGQSYFMNGQLIDNGVWLETGQPRLGQPLWDDPARYIENSPYYHADRIHTPLLILEGTNDFAGFIEGPKMFAALRRLDRPVELALYDGAGHSPSDFKASQAQDQALRMLAFLDKYLKDAPRASAQ